MNAVNPGVIITDIHKRGGMNDEAYEKFLEHSKTTHAMGRVGTVDEVAGTVAFLASDAASFITGTNLCFQILSGAKLCNSVIRLFWEIFQGILSTRSWRLLRKNVKTKPAVMSRLFPRRLGYY